MQLNERQLALDGPDVGDFHVDGPSISPLSPMMRFISLGIGAVLLNAAFLLVLPMKFVLVSFVIGVAIAGAISIPLQYALHVILFYYSFEGMVKMLTNYHPVLHVSGDILVLLFTLRSFLDDKTGGFAKVIETPQLPLFLLFSFWVVVQFANPYSLGLVPSLAGMKIYVVPPLLLYIAYHHASRDQIVELAFFIVALASFIAFVSIAEYVWGQQFMLNLSPTYLKATREIFTDSLYRPFGTTNIPGKPSTWVSLAAPFATYLLFQSRVRIPAWHRLVCVAYFFLAAPLLLICQTRLSMLQTLIGIGLVLFFNKKAFVPRLAVVGAIALFIASPILYGLTLSLAKKDTLSSAQMQVITKRVTTLGERDAYKNARQNPFPRIWSDIQKMYIFGLGLSRVGAAAGPWQDRIRNHPYFQDVHVGWADNLLIALFHEIGILGLLTYLFLYFRILGVLYAGSRDRSFEFSRGCDRFFVWTCFVLAVITLISGMAAEGALYSPVSIFLWMSFGLGLKEVTHARA